MAARKKKRPLRPRTPSRVKKRTTRKKAKARAAHEHPELIGLGLVAIGLFLASLLYLGWEGGIAGEKIESGLRDVRGVPRQRSCDPPRHYPPQFSGYH